MKPRAGRDRVHEQPKKKFELPQNGGQDLQCRRDYVTGPRWRTGFGALSAPLPAQGNGLPDTLYAYAAWVRSPGSSDRDLSFNRQSELGQPRRHQVYAQTNCPPIPWEVGRPF